MRVDQRGHAQPGLRRVTGGLIVHRLAAQEGLHHVHVWELDEQHRALEAHVVIEKRRVADLESIKSRLKFCLKEDYGIHHSTLEFEMSDSNESDCDETAAIVPH